MACGELTTSDFQALIESMRVGGSLAALVTRVSCGCAWGAQGGNCFNAVAPGYLALFVMAMKLGWGRCACHERLQRAYQ